MALCRFRHRRLAAGGLDRLDPVLHGFNLGIDFTGGVLMEVKAAQVIDISKMRSEIISLGFNDPVVQTFGNGECDKPAGSCAMIRVQPKAAANATDQNDADQAVVRAIKGNLGSAYQYRRTDVVGPTVSGELLHDGIIATLLAVAMISIYVAVRFEWQYGVGALIATGHDVFVTAGFFSVVGLDFNIYTVASLLLLAGYSINDTVVVFDRIRENRRKYKRMSLTDMINLSTNQIATRTTLVLGGDRAARSFRCYLGGPVLLNFSVAILFGIVVGTFSSTYVAAMLLLYMPAVSGGNTDTKTEEAPA